MSAPGTALVTGTTAGLGRAMAERLIEDGFRVIGVDRDHPGESVPFVHWPCDLADSAAVDDLAGRLAEAGLFDRVVFNAGISATGPFAAIPAEAHARLLAVNLEAPMVLCAALAGAGALARGGRIVFISSLSHFTGYPGAASYAASKDALAVYATSIRKPFAKKFGVGVSVAFPGPLRTAHAARHAPAGADPDKRMDAAVAARLILARAERGVAIIVPGRTARLVAFAGRIAPGPVTAAMKRIIHDRLDGPVT